MVAATGILSVPLEPDIPGMSRFAGASLFTSRWPREGVDLAGKRVGVIGTGSTGVQLIPVVAGQCEHLTVFQRSPAFTLPWQVRPASNPANSTRSRPTTRPSALRSGSIRSGRLGSSAFSVLLEMLVRPPVKSASPEEKRHAVEEHGVMGALNWGDVFFDIDANRMATELYGQAVARIVTDHTRRPR